MVSFKISEELSSFLIAAGLLAIKANKCDVSHLPPELRRQLQQLQGVVEMEYLKANLPNSVDELLR